LLFGRRILMNSIRDWIEEYEEEILLADGLDDALVGIATRFGSLRVAAYNVDLILAQLVEDGCTPVEAREYYDFNIIGAWVGELTPIFIEGMEE
tara:strand:- start:9578 stop:9859 length:282 start_codon:yes stop_codon:yes gene_type:complete